MTGWLLLTAGAAWAQQQPATVDDHLAQAELFTRRRWLSDAWQEVQRALAAPGGADSYPAHWMGAQLAYELLMLDEARALAEQAARLAPDNASADQAIALASLLAEQFGFLTLRGPQPGMTSRLQLDLESTIYDPELKQLVGRVALALRERTPLPARIGLPAGDYRINGQAVQVPAGGEVELSLPLSALGARGLAALQVARLELGAGAGLWLGSAATGLLPAPVAQLGWTQPWGPLLVGLTGELSLQGYAAGSRVYADLPAWSAGGRLGSELTLGGPLALRPSATLRYQRLPGLAYACDAAWSCWLDDGASPANHVYAAGGGIAPGLELLLEYRDAGRTTALGTGVKLAASQLFGVVSPADATLEDGSAQAWSAEDRGFGLTQITMLATFAVAF